MHRFYFPDLNFETEKMEIRDKDEIHHLKNVLRLKSGDEIVVFNGQGIEAGGEIVSVMERSVSVVISKVKELIKEGPLITLVCAIPKKAKIEFIIEKATELGVDRVIPLITKRTEMKLSRLVLNQKQKRWQAIAINAAKQSKRATVPQIVPAVSLLEAFPLTSYAVKIIGSLQEERKTLFDVLQGNKNGAYLPAVLLRKYPR